MILAAGAGLQLAERHDVEGDRHRNGHGGDEGQGKARVSVVGSTANRPTPSWNTQGRGVDQVSKTKHVEPYRQPAAASPANSQATKGAARPVAMSPDRGRPGERRRERPPGHEDHELRGS